MTVSLGLAACDTDGDKVESKSPEEEDILYVSYKETPVNDYPEVTFANAPGIQLQTIENVIDSDPPKRVCGADEMSLHGLCYSKEHLAEIQEKQDEEIKAKYQRARGAGEKAQAAHVLLEQQVQQLERTEDDLEEILELIEEKKKEGKL